MSGLARPATPAPVLPLLALLLLAPVALPATPVLAQTEGAACGDGVVEGAEQCDDGDAYPLDGCDPSCRYEQVQRLTSLELQDTSGPLACEPGTNQLGGAFSSTGLDSLNSSLQDAIDAGDLTMLFDLLDLDDATGTADPSLAVAALGADVDTTDPSPGGLDAWFRAGEELLDTEDQPLQSLTPAAIASSELVAGPGDASLPFVDGDLSMRDVVLLAQVGATVSLPAEPPSNFAPGFVAFESLDGADPSRGLCGNVTVGSLALIPVPDAFTSGLGMCESCSASRVYTSCGGGPVTESCHSLLDVLVGGCQVFGCLVTVIDPTQPDVGVDPNPPNTLIFEPTGGGIDRVTVVEPDDAYSSWFQFTSERVHLTNNLPLLFRDGVESGDTSEWSVTVSP